MNARTLAILAAVTVVVAAGALLVTAGGDRSHARKVPLPALFADITERVNDVASITVHKGEEKVVVERGRSAGDADDTNGWVVASKGGYPAKFDQVKISLMSVADVDDPTPKTADPSLHARIGVEDPAPDNAATLVTLRDKDKNEIASFIVGDAASAGSTQATYLRPADSPQAWLVEKRIDFPVDVTRWLDAEILRVDRNRIKAATITQPDGQTLHVSRASKDEQNFQVDGVPEGRELTTPAAASPVANAIAYLALEDVRRAPEASAADPADLVTTEYEIFDGLTIRVRTWTETPADGETGGSTYWATVEAIAPPAPPAAPAAESNPAPAETPDAVAAPDASAADESAPAADVGPPADLASAEPADDADKTDPALIAAEANNLNEKLAGWQFAISSYKAESLRTRLETLLKPASGE